MSDRSEIVVSDATRMFHRRMCVAGRRSSALFGFCLSGEEVSELHTHYGVAFWASLLFDIIGVSGACVVRDAYTDASSECLFVDVYAPQPYRYCLVSDKYTHLISRVPLSRVYLPAGVESVLSIACGVERLLDEALVGQSSGSHGICVEDGSVVDVPVDADINPDAMRYLWEGRKQGASVVFL